MKVTTESKRPGALIVHLDEGPRPLPSRCQGVSVSAGEDLRLLRRELCIGHDALISQRCKLLQLLDGSGSGCGRCGGRLGRWLRILLLVGGAGICSAPVSPLLASPHATGDSGGGAGHYCRSGRRSHDWSSSQHGVLAFSAGLGQRGFQGFAQVGGDNPTFDQFATGAADRFGERLRPQVFPHQYEHR